MTVLLAAALVGSWSLVVLLWPKWSPLHDYSRQTITTTSVDGKPGATTMGKVGVHATKCASEDVDITGAPVWVRQDPRGYSVERPTGVGHLSAGCTTTDFANNVPHEVAVDVCANGPSMWAITGADLPVDGAREGAAYRWRTDPFLLTCAGVP